MPRRLPIFVLFALAGCAGIFQRSMPDAAASFEARGRGVMMVGAAEADITPDLEAGGAPYLGGFDLNRHATGIASRLAVRSMVVSSGDLRVAVVGVDNLGLQREDVDWIKSGIAGFANGCVFVCSSHTHAAPDLIGLWGKWFLTSGRDRAYLSKVRAAVVDSVARAAAAQRPAVWRLGETRVPATGPIRNTNRSGVFDRRMTVLQALDRDAGTPLATLLHVPCHPEILRRGNSLVSADFVGALCDGWKARGHGQAVFVNGALGAMITPKPRGLEQMEPATGILLEAAERALVQAKPLPAEDMELRRRDVYLPMKSYALRLTRLTTVVPRELYSGCLRSSVGYLRIGDYEACCVPGEAEPGFARRIVAASGRRRLHLWGLVDDEVGYLMSERDARHPLFEYERTMSPGPTSGEIVLDCAVGARGGR